MSQSQLQTLKGDHEHCLALVELLKYAIDEKDLSRHTEKVQNFLMKWQGDLDEHFKKEEAVLLPVYARFAAIDDPDFILMFFQHVEIRKTVYMLAERIESGLRGDDLITELVQQMTEHVDHEENVLMPKMMATIPPDKLAFIAESLRKW
ncbi:MAG: hemerythrin domain-containing protein [Bacteroidetes bacterium]|nr:hemerythrin domain-containing protein [Bacteroidota bacterium]MCA0444769.1 hemerythrin domain-containing protein [Bacteroidota bacterium]